MIDHQKLLKVIRCTGRSGCNTNRCSYRKYGLVCFLACSDCKDVYAHIASFADETDSESNYNSLWQCGLYQLQNAETLLRQVFHVLLNNLDWLYHLWLLYYKKWNLHEDEIKKTIYSLFIICVTRSFTNSEKEIAKITNKVQLTIWICSTQYLLVNS